MKLGQLYHDWIMIVKLWNELLGDVMEAETFSGLNLYTKIILKYSMMIN